MIIGVPSNDFGGQEPGGVEEIEHTAHQQLRRRVPARREGGGAGREPASVLQMGGGRAPLETPRWNFHKYLIGRDGHVAAVFPTSTEPTDPKVHRCDRPVLNATE